MSFFRVIMPNYNNRQWLEKSVGSVLNQTFTDYHLIFIDDCSTDGSLEEFGRITKGTDAWVSWTVAQEKRWNGGARNIGLEYGSPLEKSDYTLFLDSDDWFHDSKVFQDLHDFIVAHDYPDCIRLPYSMEYNGDKSDNVMLDDNTIEKLAHSMFCSCWSKCVKSELIPLFPENTLMEDAVQHIKQCDLINSLEVFTDRPVYTHNRNNDNSCSIEKNHGLQNRKWETSIYRYMADLLDLELKHGYCIAERDKRSKKCLENIKKGFFIQ